MTKDLLTVETKKLANTPKLLWLEKLPTNFNNEEEEILYYAKITKEIADYVERTT